jgi:hypothetical protein
VLNATFSNISAISVVEEAGVPGENRITKRVTRLEAASDKVYQLLVHGRWFSPGTPASSTTDIAEILQISYPTNYLIQVYDNLKSFQFFALSNNAR